MQWDDVCAQPPRIIGAAGRQQWAVDGYVAFPGLLQEGDLAPLRRALDELIDQSRSLSESSHYFDLDAGHTAESPRLRRTACIDDADDAVWDFCRSSVLVDIAADVLGENVRFREAYANLKWAGGGAAVEWHQDLAFYPHTNTGTCQFIVALNEVTADRAPLTVLPGSHRQPLRSHYASDGRWVGSVDTDDLDPDELAAAVQLTGPAGSVSVHHGLLLHYSAPNHSQRSRPVFVITYTAADSIPYTSAPYRSSHYGTIVRGVEPGIAHHEELTMTLPPDWSDGYTSLFAHQASDQPIRPMEN